MLRKVLVGCLLRPGVVLAALVILAGGIFFLIQLGLTKPEYGSFRGEPKQTRDWARSGSPYGKAQPQNDHLGMSILIATPIAQVIFSVFCVRQGKES
jgi:uncharacterized membrane protein